MATLYYVDEDGTIKTIANTESPSFINEPTTASVTSLDDELPDRTVLNVEDTMKYVDKQITEFNASRLLNSTTKEDDEENIEPYKIKGLVSGKKYLVTIHGRFFTGTTDTYELGSVAIMNSSGIVLKSAGKSTKNLSNPKMYVSQEASIILDKAPSDGEIYGCVNYKEDDGSYAQANLMTALRLS